MHKCATPGLAPALNELGLILAQQQKVADNLTATAVLQGLGSADIPVSTILSTNTSR